MHKSMKNSRRWYGAIAVVVLLFLTVLAVGCQGSTGSMTNAECSDCHNDTTLVKARQVQYEESLHGAGFTSERSDASCAICHTSEGFTERVAAGSIEIAGDIENPSPVNCRTCHGIHDTYTSDDWALTVNAPVTLELTGDIFDGGTGNLCTSCHQPRWSLPVPEAGGGDIEIETTRYYPHYGTQSSMLLGVAGYGESTGKSVHYTTVTDTCTTCHMAAAYGKQSGGHTMKMEYEYHGQEVANVAGCTSCHSDIESFDHNGVQTDVQALQDELKVLLIADGIMDETDHSVKGTYSSARVGAFWNYKYVQADKSSGVHNPAYTRALLQAGIDALK